MDATRFDSLAKSVGGPPSRRQALRLLGGLAAGGLAAVAGRRPRGAAAMPSSATTQNAFVRNCENNDGDSTRISTRTVRCTYACSFYTQCNFLYSPPRCHEVLLSC